MPEAQAAIQLHKFTRQPQVVLVYIFTPSRLEIATAASTQDKRLISSSQQKAILTNQVELGSAGLSRLVTSIETALTTIAIGAPSAELAVQSTDPNRDHDFTYNGAAFVYFGGQFGIRTNRISTHTLQLQLVLPKTTLAP